MEAGQFVHVSEFYQTILTAFIFILVGIQILSFIFNIHNHISKDSIQSYQNEQQWLKHKQQSSQNQEKQSQPQYDLEKSVTNYVQNEITNMQKTQHQQKQKEKQKQQPQTQTQQQLPPRKHKLYKFYKGFNHFMNEKMAVLMPLLVLGILTQSTYVYSLAAFFFSFLCEVLIQVLEKERETRGIVFIASRLTIWLRILEIVFVMSIFISYWIVEQYNST